MAWDRMAVQNSPLEGCDRAPDLIEYGPVHAASQEDWYRDREGDRNEELERHGPPGWEWLR
jgi:hypothetical protein